jgi:hypothetical protein
MFYSTGPVDFDNENIIYYFTKQVTLIRRSTVPSLPRQLVFPALPHWTAKARANLWVNDKHVSLRQGPVQ